MKYPTEVVTLQYWDRLVAQAGELGHQLSDPEQDTEVSLVAECRRCESTFGVDGQERPHVFGTGLRVECSVV